MRLRTSIESDLRSRIEDELRDLDDRRGHVDRFLRAEDVSAYRAAVAKASAAARGRPTLIDEQWLAPPSDRPSFVPPPSAPVEERPSSQPPRSLIPPPAPDPSVRASSRPAPLFETTLRASSYPTSAFEGPHRPSSYPPAAYEAAQRMSTVPPPPASSVSSVWSAADIEAEMAFARPRPRKGLLLAALAILTITVALFGSAATRAEIPTARASASPSPMNVACAELTTLDEQVVVTAPAPTLKPVTHHHRSRSATNDDANKEQPSAEETATAGKTAAAATPSATATNPSLDDAARTARMLREQLDGARH